MANDRLDKRIEETGYVMRSTRIPSIFGIRLNGLKTPGHKYLCIGEEERTVAIKTQEARGLHVEILHKITGTREAIRSAFLKELEEDNLTQQSRETVE